MLLHKLLVTTNLEAYSEQLQNKGITSLDALHAMTVSSEPRQTFLALGQECGMSTNEISRLFKASTDSAVQAEKAAKAQAEANAAADAAKKAEQLAKDAAAAAAKDGASAEAKAEIGRAHV